MDFIYRLEMRKIALLSLPSLLLLGSCDLVHGDARRAVSDKLTDPDSAEFKDWFACPSGDGWTGKVNSKT
jgi:hypothetical protein